MTTLMSLSDDVLDIILSYSDISFEDIINFRCVCKKFCWAAKTEENLFLKKKFFQRWCSAKKYYDEKNEQKQSKGNKQNNEKLMRFIEKGINCAKQLRNYVQQYMSLPKRNKTVKFRLETLLKKNLEEDLSKEDLSELMFKNKNYIKFLLFMDEIKHLLDQPARVGCDLTKGYYYILLFDYLRLFWRNVILKKYSEEPCKELLEESATIWAQQLQLDKNISYSSVKASLKSIALDALNFLRAKHPEHSIFSTSDEYFSYWENNNINDNYWSETEGTQIMDTLEEYMFGKFQLYLSIELEYACIDYVLENKHGSDIILYIIYESVARRLGLRCDLVHTPYCSKIINILWIPRYTFAADYKKDIRLLDKEHRRNMRYLQVREVREAIYLRSNCDSTYWDTFRPIYKRTAAEMLKLNMDVDDKFNRRFSDRNILLRLHQFVPKIRPKNVKFAVGMIVTHNDDSKTCSTGVIIGWLQICSKFISYTDNISFLIMPLKMCSSFSTGQTCYIILTKSDELCCVKEDDVALTKPMWITNKNIYHYFSKFEGTHYVPNEELAEAYPHDAAIAAGTIFKS